MRGGRDAEPRVQALASSLLSLSASARGGGGPARYRGCHELAWAVARVHTRLGAGALAGLVAQSITYPLDVVRRRMQVQIAVAPRNASKVRTAGPQPDIYTGVLQATRQIYHTEGLAGLYKGLVRNTVVSFRRNNSTCPACSATPCPVMTDHVCTSTCA